MKRNVGSLDKVLRIVLGASFIVLGIVLKSWWAIVLGIFGVILIFTAIFGFCLLYVPFKINTAKSSKKGS